VDLLQVKKFNVVEKNSFYQNRLTLIKEKLNAVGPGMCLAKWSQVSLHLQNGHNHSCHHPNTHQVSLDEIVVDVSALHNTNFKKETRKQMMTGVRPEECHYCWNVEDNAPEDVFSDRILKTSEPWSLSLKDLVLELGHKGNINPSYLEVSFSHSCNFKCSYCGPHISSKWMEEIEKYGGYPTSRRFNDLNHIKHQNKMPIPERDENPYVEAFWEWWPTLYPGLHTFRITGGEPLMTKHTFNVLDYIIENPNPKMELAINSNCVVEDKLFDRFIEKIKIIEENQAVRSVTLYTSCEAHGKKAEYIRHGLDYNKWLVNCSTILSKIPSLHFSIMSTYNALSVTSYRDFLNDVLKLKKDYKNDWRNIEIDIPYLDHPKWLNIGILPDTFKSLISSQIEFMNENKIANLNLVGFSSKEINKLERIKYLFQDTPDHVDQKDFVLFFDEHDRRRNTNFLETFPEMTEFYNYCKTLP
jgi:organic radical activating enzyme